MKRLPYNEERIRLALNYMLTPECSNAEMATIMEASARALSANARVRRSNANKAHRDHVASVRASGDMAALRKLANENLAKRRK